MSLEPHAGLLFREVPAAVVRLEPSGRVREANPVAARLLGRSPQSLDGRPFLEIVHQDDRRLSGSRFSEVLRGFEREWDARLLRGDGAPRRQRVRAVPYLPQGEVDEVVVFLSAGDSTPHPWDEARQLLNLLENIPGRFVTVLDGQGRIRHASGMSWTHHRADLDFLDMEYCDLLEDDDSRALAGEMLVAARGGEDWRGVQTHRRADGASFPARLVASPLRDTRTGRLAGVIVAGVDITSEQELEVEAARAGRLASVGSITREIAVRLTDLVGRSDLTPARRLADVGEVLDGLLEFTDLRDARPTYLDPASLVRRSLEHWPHDHLQVEVSLPEGLPSVHCDEAGILRALDLVLRHASETLEHQGFGQVGISLLPSDEWVRIGISNDGTGISRDRLESIFRPFEDGTGSGLALAVARALVDTSGGRIWAESALARGRGESKDSNPGATIFIELPISSLPGARTFRAEPMSLGDERAVLVVDDDPSVRLALRKGLERVGYRVEEAWSGRSAMASITGGHSPDAVITDLRMLDGSGYWLLDQLARYYPGLVPRTLIVTGDGRRSRAQERGCPVLVKPIDFRELLQTLHETIAN